MHITSPAYESAAELALPAAEVHLWRVDLEAVASGEARWGQLLSSDEQARAQAYRFPSDRQRYITVRALLRTLLGAYTGRDPRDLVFSYSDKGKPALIPTGGDPEIQFNVSHSGGASLLAFATRRDLGVDVESLHRKIEHDAIARRFFSTREQQQFSEIAPQDRSAAFFRCWTRKEAYLKATGAGLSLPLGQFDVSIAEADTDSLLETRPDPAEASRWTLAEVPAGAGFVGALCARGKGWRLKSWSD